MIIDREKIREKVVAELVYQQQVLIEKITDNLCEEMQDNITVCPTHEQIMSLWWCFEKVHWIRVKKYDTSISTNCCYQLTNGRYVNKRFFIGKKSAEIPPERI